MTAPSTLPIQPGLPRRTVGALAFAWLLFWVMMIATAVQDFARHGGSEHYWMPVLWESTSAITSTILLITARRFTERYDYMLATPLRWFANQARGLLLFWVAFVPLAFGMRHAVYALMGDVYHHEPWPETFLYEDVKITIFFGLFTAVLFGVLSYQAMLNERVAAERAQASLQQARLLQLTQQMQPHFLFNALNTISSVMHSDVERADALLIQLSDMLRATLDTGEQHQVPLELELRLLRGYAALMAERFADRVEIAWQIDESLMACHVPVMSMQPLLENIFKHTVERRRGLTRISISVAREGQHLVLRLADDSGILTPSPQPEAGASGGLAASMHAGAGIGLRNLRQRLAALHGVDGTLTLTQLAPSGVQAEIRLPCAS
jgi:signal transduction histidine kinase